MKDDIPALFVLKGGFGKKQLKQIFEDINKAKENGNIVILAISNFMEGYIGSICRSITPHGREQNRSSGI